MVQSEKNAEKLRKIRGIPPPVKSNGAQLLFTGGGVNEMFLRASRCGAGYESEHRNKLRKMPDSRLEVPALVRLKLQEHLQKPQNAAGSSISRIKALPKPGGAFQMGFAGAGPVSATAGELRFRA